MTDERWHRIEDIYHAVLGREAAARHDEPRAEVASVLDHVTEKLLD